MAEHAATGYWHDFLSPLSFPKMDLVSKLAALRTPGATKLAEAVMNGDFDATNAEAAEWYKSAEGQRVSKAFKKGMN